MALTNKIAATDIMTLLRFSLFLITLAFSSFSPAEESTTGFDHFDTGFPLIGRHEFIDCSDCHIAGQFTGTPLECGICHNGIRAPGKNVDHPPSSNFCDDCHTERTWLGARFDHIEVQEACQNCHDNNIAIGKSASHIPVTTPTCDDCHNTISFDRVARVDHSAVSGLCTSCHNGVIATGENPGHIDRQGEECNLCHTVFSWLPANVPPGFNP